MASSAMWKYNTDCVLGIGIRSTSFNELIDAPDRLLLAVHTDDMKIARPSMLFLVCCFFQIGPSPSSTSHAISFLFH